MPGQKVFTLISNEEALEIFQQENNIIEALTTYCDPLICLLASVQRVRELETLSFTCKEPAVQGQAKQTTKNTTVCKMLQLVTQCQGDTSLTLGPGWAKENLTSQRYTARIQSSVWESCMKLDKFLNYSKSHKTLNKFPYL